MKLEALRETKQRKAGKVMQVKHGVTRHGVHWYQVNGKFCNKQTWENAVAQRKTAVDMPLGLLVLWLVVWFVMVVVNSQGYVS